MNLASTVTGITVTAVICGLNAMLVYQTVA